MNVTPELDRRFRAAALAGGVADVRYDLVDTPLGTLGVAATERGLCRIAYVTDGLEDEPDLPDVHSDMRRLLTRLVHDLEAR